MSFLKKVLSKMGIGAASVATELFTKLFIPGEPVKGVVNIKAGSVEQQIDAIYFKIKSTFEDEVEVEGSDGEEEEISVTRRAVLMEFKISEPFTLGPDESISFDLDFILPIDTPATVGKTRTWVETGLDIKRALDPKDRDYIHVLPHPVVDTVLESATGLGLEISQVVCEPAPEFMNMRLPFVQEFELKPVQGPFQSRLDEVELIFKPLEDSVEVFMEVDRKARGISGSFAEILGSDETMICFTVHHSETDRFIVRLNDLIEKYC